MYTLLLVDDEQRMLDLLSLYLTPNGYQCVKCQSGLDAIRFLENNQVDLVLLDVMMQGLSGWETCKRIKEIASIPIIMLTARDQTVDVVRGLNIGADDYITKPFDEMELLARIGAVLRRYHPHTSRVEIEGLIWDEDQYKVSYHHQPIEMTPKEFGILGLLLKHPNRVFSREQMITTLWGYDADIEVRTIDSHVRNVREKLRKAGFPSEKYLQTVWGVGYKWEGE